VIVQLGGQPVTIHSGLDLADMVPAPGIYGLDVESTYLTDREQFDPEFRVRLVQIATKDEAWVFDVSDRIQREIIERLLRTEDLCWSSHSPMDVHSVWTYLGIDISERNVDTLMLATQADPDKSEDRDLKSLATAYGMPELEEGEKTLHARFMEMWVAQGGKRNAKRADIQAYGWANIPADDPAYVLYAGLDAIACRRLAELLIPATQNPPEVIRADAWLGTRCNRMRMRGWRVDTDALDAFHDESVGVCEAAKARTMELTGGVNPAGNKIHAWFSEHGVDWREWTGARTDTGAPSLAKENIKLLYDFPLDDTARAAVDEMVTFKSFQDQMNKAKGLRKILVLHDDGIHRAHPTINPVGASTTARMSSSGWNMQNASKANPRMRGLFTFEDGHSGLGIDFDQIELRTVAALAREESMIETILAGGDLHQLTADLVTAQGSPISRQIAKMVNFLIVYGGGPKALHEQSGIPLDTARQVINSFREAYPAISAYSMWMGMNKEAIRTISNRRLPVTRNKKTGDLRTYANVNYVVQSSARELLVRAWQTIEAQYPGVVWLPIHDELVLQVPDGMEREVAEAAEAAMRFDFRGVPISATSVELRDEAGISRWMTCDRAEAIAKERVAACRTPAGSHRSTARGVFDKWMSRMTIDQEPMHEDCLAALQPLESTHPDPYRSRYLT
jgi:DNA polymerase-1